MPKIAKLSPLQTRKEFDKLSREPFREQMAEWMECSPDPKALQTFANKYPDRWAQGVAIFGRLSGYSDKVEVETTLYGNLSLLSDVELLKRFNDLQAKLQAIEGETIDVTPESPHALDS